MLLLSYLLGLPEFWEDKNLNPLKLCLLHTVKVQTELKLHYRKL